MKKMPLIVLALSAKGIKFIDGDSKVSLGNAREVSDLD